MTSYPLNFMQGNLLGRYPKLICPLIAHWLRSKSRPRLRSLSVGAKLCIYPFTPHVRGNAVPNAKVPSNPSFHSEGICLPVPSESSPRLLIFLGLTAYSGISIGLERRDRRTGLQPTLSSTFNALCISGTNTTLSLSLASVMD
jgi:hypothetical protein